MENSHEHETNVTTAVSTNLKRKSRFESVRSEDTNESIADEVKDPPFKKINIDINAAALRAAEISKELSSKVSFYLDMIVYILI